MTAFWVIGAIVLVVLLIGSLRVGALVSFGDALCVRARIGVLRLTVYPQKGKAPKGPKEEKPREEKPKKAKKSSPLPKPTFDELEDLLATLLSALGAAARRACRRLRIDPMDVTVVFGGDPARSAIRYGRASAAMYALMPRLEECFRIPNPSLHLRVDFDAEGTRAFGTVGATLRVRDLLAIFFTLAIPMLKWYLRFRRSHRHDTAEAAELPEEKTIDDKIA